MSIWKTFLEGIGVQPLRYLGDPDQTLTAINVLERRSHDAIDRASRIEAQVKELEVSSNIKNLQSKAHVLDSFYFKTLATALNERIDGYTKGMREDRTLDKANLQVQLTEKIGHITDRLDDVEAQLVTVVALARANEARLTSIIERLRAGLGNA